MPKDEQITGAPYPIKVNGKEYRARTLTDRDFDELTAWVRWKFVEDSKKIIDSMALPREDRQEMMTSTMLAASQVSFNSVEGSRIANGSTEGFARVGWQMIHHYHPKMTVEDFIKEVSDEETYIENLEQINQAFIYLNIGGKDESEDEGDSDDSEKSNEVGALPNSNQAP